MPGHFLCTHDVYTTTQQTYSVIHLAIQLSYLLVLLGLFYIYITCETLNFYMEQLRYSTDNISVYRCNSSACTNSEFYDVCLFYVFLFCFIFHLLLSKAAYVYDCVYKSNTCLSPFTKGMVKLLSQKASST